MEIHSASGQEAVGESLQRYCSTEGTPPLLLFPEEDTTNGRAGLLKFRLVPTFLLQDLPTQCKNTCLIFVIEDYIDIICEGNWLM